MTYIAAPRYYTAGAFASLVDKLQWNKGWKPLFPTLHNTGIPTLKTYLGWGQSQRDRWGANLDHFYQGKGWHSGPHVVVCPDGILYLCDLEQDGVSVSCWNHLTIGIEMTLDGSTEDFSTADGAKVRDNAVAVIAALSKKLGWKPDPLVLGKSGLHFHAMCTKDHHPCPGKNVSRADMVARVKAALSH